MHLAESRGLESLQVWVKAVEFATRVCTQLLPNLPVEEKWALTSQTRRSVYSIPANIAEGYGRYYYQEGVRFCYIARGSLEETFSHLTLAHKLGYISPDVFHSLVKEIDDLRRLLAGYINYLKRSKRGQNEPGAGFAVREESSDYLYPRLIHVSLSP